MTMAGWQRVRRRWEAALATWTLIAALAGLAAAAGTLVAGDVGAVIALGAALGSTLLGTPYMDRYLLRRLGARPLDEREAPRMAGILRDLARRAEVPVPSLWLVPGRSPNAFTIGRDPATASVVVSTGLLERLDARSMAAVLAHEVAHIRNRDILLQSFAASITSMLRSAGRAMGLLVLLAFPILVLTMPRALLLWALLTVAPMLALLLQMALSRQREFAADAEAARLTGDPEGLAVALRRIDTAEGSPLRWLLGPRGGGDVATPWSSHPATAERVARLRAMASAGPVEEAASPTPHRRRSVARPAALRPLRPVYVPIRVLPGHRPVPRVTSRREAYRRAV